METQASNEEYGRLLQLASPQLYRRNLFRQLGLPVTATAADVRRRQGRLEIQRKLGLSAESQDGGVLAIDPPPGEEDIRVALERLVDPEARLLDEVFWFWPMNGASAADPALAALAKGDCEQAAAIWRRAAGADGAGQIALHNLAVLDHLTILDREARAAEKGSGPKRNDEYIQLWVRILAQWQKVFESEDYWAAVRERVRIMDDQKLTSGMARRIRGTLPRVLLLINARIAYAAAERGDVEAARLHIRLVHEAPYGNGHAEAAIREALKPLRNRIKSATDNARSRWVAAPHRGGQYVRELHQQAKGLLAIVDAALPADDPVRVGLHDMVGDTMRDGAVAYVNRTNNWKEGMALLELARPLAAGEALQANIQEQLRIMKEQAEAANDWCSADYWDQPDEALALLEAARQKADAGDLDGAIDCLALLDPAIGKPLRRSLGYSLSLKGIRVFNAGMDEYNLERGAIKKILDRLRAADSLALGMLLRMPTPSTPSFMMPECLCCGSKYYTQWVTFTYREMRLFMCSSCSAADDREIARAKTVLRGHIAKALEYILLADEIDPGDAGVRRNLATIKQRAADNNCPIPKTKDLRKKLGASRVRATPLVSEIVAVAGNCHFCGSRPADPECSIAVPMCGDRRQVSLTFGEGAEYRFGDIVVPRCRRCKDEHRLLAERLRDWQSALDDAAAEHNFPRQVAAVDAARKVVLKAGGELDAAKQGLSAAEEEMQVAGHIGTLCGGCKSGAPQWSGHLCRKCDAKLFTLSEGARFALIAGSIGSLLLLVVLGAPGWLGLGFPLVGGLMAHRLASRRLGAARGELARQRAQASAQEKADAEAKNRPRLEKAQSAAVAAETALRDAESRSARARQGLDEAKASARAEYERAHARPALPAGIRGEAEYVSCPRIVELQKKSWGFGSSPRAGSDRGADAPVDVRGLVVVSRPVGRDAVVELARGAGRDASVTCPVCKLGIKAKNLVSHYDKLHAGPAAGEAAACG